MFYAPHRLYKALQTPSERFLGSFHDKGSEEGWVCGLMLSEEAMIQVLDNYALLNGTIGGSTLRSKVRGYTAAKFSVCLAELID